jgi:hypothetical protein
MNASSMGSFAVLSHSFVMLMVIVTTPGRISPETFGLNAFKVVLTWTRNPFLKTGFARSN